MKRWLAAAPLLIFAVLVILFAVYALGRKTAQVSPDAMVGKPLPAAVALQGPGLVNIFASWCAPCAVEHPQLMALKSEGVQVLGIAYKDEPAKTAAFLARLGNPFDRVLNDHDGRLGIELGISGVPETFAVDRRGIIVAKHSGPMTQEDSRRLLAQLRATN